MSNTPNGDKNPVGRPSIYTKELADLICMLTATNTFGLRKLCKLHNELPVVDTIYQWRYKYKDFSEQYAEAKLKQAELMAEEILEICDDGTNDWMATLGDEEQGMGWRLNGEHVNRSRLRIDTRKWLASKLLPKTYGPPPKEDDNKNPSAGEEIALRKKEL